MINKKIKYAEPAEYFPKKIRKKYKIGEYSEELTPADYDRWGRVCVKFDDVKTTTTLKKPAGARTRTHRTPKKSI